MNDEELRELVQARGGDAVRAAAAGDWEAAGRVAGEISTHPGGLVMLLYGLCDTVIDVTRRAQGIPDGDAITLVQPVWKNLATGQVTESAGDVPGYQAWCGQFLAARSLMDQDTCTALIGVFPDDWETASDYIMALLASCVAVTGLNQPGG